jgi:hypothetical protein
MLASVDLGISGLLFAMTPRSWVNELTPTKSAPDRRVRSTNATPGPDGLRRFVMSPGCEAVFVDESESVCVFVGELEVSVFVPRLTMLIGSPVAEASKSGQHGAESVEQREDIIDLQPWRQSEQLDCLESCRGLGSLAASAAEPRQSIAPGTTGRFRDAEDARREPPSNTNSNTDTPTDTPSLTIHGIRRARCDES